MSSGAPRYQLKPRALGAEQFASLMDRFGPFEMNPHIAAGVSGGADSLALAVLLQVWARARGGKVTALTVDHGLRPESAAEARKVGQILRRAGIAHRVLTWDGPAPAANIQAEARRRRYRLMEDWCARRGVLHLASAHHQEDQAETLLLRLGRGSGLEGLSAMPSVLERTDLRILRPLLDVPKARLAATLVPRGIGWIEDPSNQDIRHARVRMRRLAPALAAEGLNAERLAATAGGLGRARAALEACLADLELRAVRLHPAGHAQMAPAVLAPAPDELALRGLARLLMSIGGAEYPPRLVRLERLLADLRLAIHKGVIRATTLGGCKILPRGGNRPYLLITRETRGLGTTALTPGETVLWDGRFEVEIKRQKGTGKLGVGPLGAQGSRFLGPGVPSGSAIPAAVRPSLPAISDSKGVLAVPHLGYQRTGTEDTIVVKCRFAPKNGLSPATFTVV